MTGETEVSMPERVVTESVQPVRIGSDQLERSEIAEDSENYVNA